MSESTAQRIYYDEEVFPTSSSNYFGGDVLTLTPNYTFDQLSNIRDKFYEFAGKWQEETMDLSSLDEILAHPSYLAIIGMGKPVLPILFAELEQNPNFWFTAIESILTANSEKADITISESDQGNLRALSDAWLQWGRSQSYI